ncbi:MAG: hypothetical protein H7Y37_02955 [Anaerolineae bacterium]|nr:hypothetical protein [Gloeobacterales cyanobacterium ES-bin-313]
MVILLYEEHGETEMEEQFSREEKAHIAALIQVIAERNTVACQQVLKRLESLMRPDDLANLVTEVMAILAPVDFAGTIWLLEALDQKQPQDLQDLFSSEIADRYTTPTPQSAAPANFLAVPDVLILTSIGAYALGLDPNAQTGIILMHVPTGEHLQVFEDEATALDAMIALESHENLHKRDELIVTGHDKPNASPWIV